jgi:hypothetical protein
LLAAISDVKNRKSLRLQSNLVRSERFVSESLRIRNSVADPLKLRW